MLAFAVSNHRAEVEWLAWDDPQVDWASWDVLVLRSTWNYLHHADVFSAWISHVGRTTRIYNGAEIVRWNLHKKYLVELAEKGLPVIPTQLVAAQENADLEEIMDRHGWDRAVIKPAVSAGSFGTKVVQRDDLEEGQRFLRTMILRRDMMVQPYVKSVEGYGERSLIWIDGKFTHAIRKSPRFSGDREDISGPFPMAEDELAVALKILQAVEGDLLYGRVDLARDEKNAPMLMELELIEPSLFLQKYTPALDRLARGIVARASLV